MGKYCTGWFDGNYGHCCAAHDDSYIILREKSKFQYDLGLFKCVWKKNKFQAVVMFIGLTVIPISYYYWFKYKKDRNVK